MPDLASELSAILSDPEAQKNIMAMLSSLGTEEKHAGQPAGEAHPPAPDLSALSSLFGGGKETARQEAPALDMNTLLSLQKVFSQMNADDKNVALLRALKPHLHKPERADDAIRLLQLLSVLPALGELGLFGRRQA